MTETPQATPAASPDAEARLSKVQSELNALESKLKRDARFTLFVVLVLLGLLTGYFSYGYTQFSAILEPKELVAVVASIVDENIEPARESLEAEIEKQAPIVAQNLSDQAIAAIPSLREQLEEFLIDQSRKTVDEAIGDSTARFDDILDQHRPEIESLISEMKERDDASAEVMASLEEVMNQEIGEDMQSNAEEVLGTIVNLRESAERLRDGQGLSEKELILRQIGMIGKRLVLESENPDLEIQGELSKPILSTAPTDPPEAAKEGENATSDEKPEDETESNEEDSADKPEGDKPESADGDDKPAESEEETKESAEEADSSDPPAEDGGSNDE